MKFSKEWRNKSKIAFYPTLDTNSSFGIITDPPPVILQLLELREGCAKKHVPSPTFQGQLIKEVQCLFLLLTNIKGLPNKRFYGLQ